ncbi:MAG TPA: YccF domain-containing protein [Myxococcaceae bacterium]|nr:YccF domain-containing protein [Myxococcaceae bacterium]
MRFILNLLWFVLGGFLIFIEYVAVGLLLCLTLVGIPWGLACFRLAGLGAWPFGREVVSDPSGGVLGGGMRLLANVIWLVVAGIWICLTHLGLAISLAVTIIGLPFAFQHFKFALVALAPFGQRVVVRP